MAQNLTGKIILSIESAVGGGSIALTKGTEILGSTAGNESVSRAEELLPNIKELLSLTGIRQKQLGAIAVSRGPGSFTGIRIGISTALGLARGLGIECIGISLIQCILESSSLGPDAIIAIPVGRTDIAWQCVSGERKTETRVDDLSVFVEKISECPRSTILLHSNILKMLPAEQFPIERIREIDNDLAGLIGLQAPNWIDRNDLSPIYLHNEMRAGNLF